MENQILTPTKLFSQKNIQQRFEKLLGEQSQGFISSVLQIVNNNKLLASADPTTILNAAITSAVLELPIDPNLGFAWIVPYKGKAQFQIGWRGFVQLAIRSGKYKQITAFEVYENQFISFNQLTEEIQGNFDIEGVGEVVGYITHFTLKSGFSKTAFWTKERVIKHAKKYSQTYGKSFPSPWNDKDQFDAMGIKTVLKNTLAKYGILSIKMQMAQMADQSVQNSEGIYDYVDNENIIDLNAINEEEEISRLKPFIDKSVDKSELEDLKLHVANPKIKVEIDNKIKELENAKLF